MFNELLERSYDENERSLRLHPLAPPPWPAFIRSSRMERSALDMALEDVPFWKIIGPFSLKTAGYSDEEQCTIQEQLVSSRSAMVLRGRARHG